MAALPAGPLRWQIVRETSGAARRRLHQRRLVARRKVDVLHLRCRRPIPYLAAAVSGWQAGAGSFGPTEEEGIAINPEGRSLLTSVGMEESAVWIRDSNGERQISSEGFAEWPSLSPDGTKAYYLVRPPGGTRSFTSGASGGGVVESGELRAVELKGGNIRN